MGWCRVQVQVEPFKRLFSVAPKIPPTEKCSDWVWTQRRTEVMSRTSPTAPPPFAKWEISSHPGSWESLHSDAKTAGPLNNEPGPGSRWARTSLVPLCQAHLCIDSLEKETHPMGSLFLVPPQASLTSPAYSYLQSSGSWRSEKPSLEKRNILRGLDRDGNSCAHKPHACSILRM